jgi:tripartite-type tricarboxylate transporter receptor subunit TctC
MLSRRSALALAPATLTSGAAVAQPAWPSRSITIIVPFGPGGGTDILARLLAQHIAPPLGQSVVVDNRAGATGTVGMAALARSRRSRDSSPMPPPAPAPRTIWASS